MNKVTAGGGQRVHDDQEIAERVILDEMNGHLDTIEELLAEALGVADQLLAEALRQRDALEAELRSLGRL